MNNKISDIINDTIRINGISSVETSTKVCHETFSKKGKNNNAPDIREIIKTIEKEINKDK
jgi:hypothetical protein